MAANPLDPEQTQIVASLRSALAAYRESWRVVQGLYAEEDQIYNERIIEPSAGIQAALNKLRDDGAQEPAVNTLIRQARDGFMTAQSWAFRYRSSSKPTDADQFTAIITASIDALNQAAGITTTEGMSSLSSSRQALWDSGGMGSSKQSRSGRHGSLERRAGPVTKAK